MVLVGLKNGIQVPGLKMNNSHRLKIYSVVVLGLGLFVATFLVVWDVTEAYRENINRPQKSSSETVKNNLK